MEKKLYENYLNLLKVELVPALGCTEPIALAYGAAKARDILGSMPEQVNVWCSGNIIKNVKGVKVPNSGGMKGVEAAVILGTVGGNGEKALEVLETVNEAHRAETKELLDRQFCKCFLREGVANLFIEIHAIKGEDEVVVRIENGHTNITLIEKNGEKLYENNEAYKVLSSDKSMLNVEDIVEFANTVEIDDVKSVLDYQIECNMAISDEGLTNDWGVMAGKTILEENGDSLKWRAVARAAAGSDARMSGCSMPVVINSGSGNQGMTCSLPVIEYARGHEMSQEQLYRALCVSNLIALNQKKYIGSLSAYCGAVCAAAAAGAAITYLQGGTVEQIGNTVVNTIGNVGGMVCDGAKASCATKIAAALDAAFLGSRMALKDVAFESGDGLVMENPEKTIQSVGHMAKAGMAQTDIEILNLMIGETELA